MKNRINNKNNIWLRTVVVMIASVILAFNIKSLVRTGGILPGGATGLTLLIQETAYRYWGAVIPYTPVNIAINAIPVYIGFKYIGKRFTTLSCVVIVLTGILADLLPEYMITDDLILISVFGGIINGIAVSLCLQMDATSGGTDFLAIYLSKTKGIDGFSVALCINTVILAAAGILFGWEKALYSIILQYVSTSVIHVLYRKYQQTTLFVVTRLPDEICSMIFDMTKHGATIIYGKGSYEEKADRSVVYSVVASNQVTQVVSAIQAKDPEAFVNSFKSEKISGRFYRIPED